MNRRRALVALVAASIVASTGSSRPAAAGDDAARVNGESISVDDFEAAIEGLGDFRPDLAPDPTTDTVAAGQGRQLLQLMILNRIRPMFLAEQGVEIDDGQWADADTAISQQEAQAPLPEPLRGEAVADFAYRSALGELPAPDEEALRAAYSEWPASTGVVCLNVISIVGDAEQAAEALRGGASARDVVADAGNGSRVQDQCLSLGELGVTVPGLFHDLIELRAGEMIDPIATSGGHQILQVAAFDDISAELVEYFAAPPPSPNTGEAPTAGELMLMGYVVTADVSVNPRYGRWDAATASIVPLGQP